MELKVNVNTTKANLKSKDEYKYFLYSETQQKQRTEIEARINRIFVPGQVVVKGQPQLYTELSRKNTNSFTDTKIVAEGYLSQFNYTNIQSKNK